MVKPVQHGRIPCFLAELLAKRAALPNARVMIHQPLGGFRGQASDIQIHAQEILKIKHTLNDRLAFHTGQSIERIEKDTDRDNLCQLKKHKRMVWWMKSWLNVKGIQ